MSIIEIILLAIGLAMDAFAVSICKGLSTKKVKLKHMLIAGAWFGGFQAFMPLIGFILGQSFQKYIEAFDHWIAFVLLAFIGANMVKEAFSSEDEETNDSFGVKTMFLMAVATSIDALAVGVTLAFLKVDIIWAISIIGSITFVISLLGVKIGSIFGARYKSKAEITGGVILIIIGTKILIQHLSSIV